ncbi:MAG TPA: hypothetical protein PKN86_16250, partial [Candidatus Obscuribacter sp.]|nr:hypothetical protein [Candidatus Obscuribacter sp.]
LSLGSVAALVTLGMTFSLGALGFTAVLPVMAASILARLKANKLKDKFFHEICRLPGPDQNPEQEENLNFRRRQGLTDIACAVLTAFSQTKHLPPIKKESLQVTVRSDGSYRVFLDDVEPRASKVFNQALKEVLAPIGNQPFLIPKYEFPLSEGQSEAESRRFFNKYLSGRAEPRVAAYHAVPALLARSEKGREAFQESWNKYVSPGFIVSTETKPELLNKYFGIGPSLAQRLLWE